MMKFQLCTVWGGAYLGVWGPSWAQRVLQSEVQQVFLKEDAVPKSL